MGTAQRRLLLQRRGGEGCHGTPTGWPWAAPRYRAQEGKQQGDGGPGTAPRRPPSAPHRPPDAGPVTGPGGDRTWWQPRSPGFLPHAPPCFLVAVAHGARGLGRSGLRGTTSGAASPPAAGLRGHEQTGPREAGAGRPARHRPGRGPGEKRDNRRPLEGSEGSSAGCREGRGCARRPQEGAGATPGAGR